MVEGLLLTIWLRWRKEDGDWASSPDLELFRGVQQKGVLVTGRSEWLEPPCKAHALSSGHISLVCSTSKPVAIEPDHLNLPCRFYKANLSIKILLEITHSQVDINFNYA